MFIKLPNDQLDSCNETLNDKRVFTCIYILEVNAGAATQEITNSATTNTRQVSIPKRSVPNTHSLTQTTVKELVQTNKPGEQPTFPLLKCQEIKQSGSSNYQGLSIIEKNEKEIKIQGLVCFLVGPMCHL